jgi:hypothetical protein
VLFSFSLAKMFANFFKKSEKKKTLAYGLVKKIVTNLGILKFKK